MKKLIFLALILALAAVIIPAAAEDTPLNTDASAAIDGDTHETEEETGSAADTVCA